MQSRSAVSAVLAPGALDSDVYWPAQLCLVRPHSPGPGADYQLPTNGPTITRTVARFIQAPAQDPPGCSSTRQCCLQLWVSCTVVRPIGAVVTVQRVRRRLQTRHICLSVSVYVRVVFVCPQYSPNKISPATAWLSLCSLLD